LRTQLHDLTECQIKFELLHISVTFPLECHLSADVLRYEALLDQGFHRDLILLQKLKEMAPVSDTRGRRPLKSERGLIEGGSTSDAVSQV